MARHINRSFGTIIILFFAIQVAGQSGNFYLFQYTKDFQNPLYTISENDYKYYADSIHIDTTCTSKYANLKVWIIEDHNQVGFFNLSSSECFKVGTENILKNSKHVQTLARYSVRKPMINYIVDSLNNVGAQYKVYPSLETKFQYVLEFTAFFKDYKRDPSLTIEENDSIFYDVYCSSFYENFREIFPEVKSDQIKYYMGVNDYIEMAIILEEPDFDVQKLKSLGIYFRHEPVVRKEIFEVTVFQTYFD